MAHTRQVACSKCQELKIKLLEAKESKTKSDIRRRLRNHIANKHLR